MGTILAANIAEVEASFHSISFPSEWGQPLPNIGNRICKLKVSIQLVSPASGDHYTHDSIVAKMVNRFHSISFPSEWGPVNAVKANPGKAGMAVSIQLVSPASGDKAFSLFSAVA